MDILPGQGIGPIRHGMRPAEVLAVFPEPQVYEDWMGGNRTMLYCSAGCDCTSASAILTPRCQTARSTGW